MSEKKQHKYLSKYKNHFCMPYLGNKREEIDEIYKCVDFENIDTIIEPFCGSSGFSFFTAQKYPKKFKYILNDNDKHLIKLYEMMQDKNKFSEFIDKIAVERDKVIGDKKKYDEYIKNDDVFAYFLAHSIYMIRPGMYPIDGRIKKIHKHYPIMDFLENENVNVLCEDGFDMIERYKNMANVFIFLDPPYVDAGGKNDKLYFKNLNGNQYVKIYKYFIGSRCKFLAGFNENYLIKDIFSKFILWGNDDEEEHNIYYKKLYKYNEFDKYYKFHTKNKGKHLYFTNYG